MRGIRIENNKIYATKDHFYKKEGTEGGTVIGDVYLDELSWVEVGSSIINKGDRPMKLYNSVLRGNSIIHSDNKKPQGESDPSPSLLPPKAPSILLNSVINEESVLRVNYIENELMFQISDSILKGVCINCDDNSCDAKHNLIIRKSNLNRVRLSSYSNLHVKLYIWKSKIYDLEFHFKQNGEDMGDIRVFNSDLKKERYMFRNYANVNIYGRTSLGLETKNIIYIRPSGTEGTQEIIIEEDSFKTLETKEL